ncbi:MAG: transposase [Parcubacteria group bacterium]
MSERKQLFAPCEYYHLYNRGVEKRKIFLDKQDYKHFLRLMYLCNSKRSIILRDIGKNFDRGEIIVEIGAYCLMPNHFHILVREKIEGGISTYMRKLLTAYSMYFNKKYKRTGTLYENTFKSTHCSRDTYLKYLYAYIHLNPAKLVDKNWRNNKRRNVQYLANYAFAYPYSSMYEYLGHNYIIDPANFPRYYLSPHDHKRELFEWLANTP